MLGTNIHEFTNVTAASAKCPTRSLPATDLSVASGSTMATRLSMAAIITPIRMKGADSSSSRYLEQICCADRPFIQANNSARNSATPQFQHTNTRLRADQA